MWSFRDYLTEAHQKLDSTSTFIASTIVKQIVAGRTSGGWYGEDSDGPQYTPIEYKLKHGPHRFVRFSYTIKKEQKDIDFLDEQGVPFLVKAGYKVTKDYDYHGDQVDSPSVTVWISTMYWPFPKELLNSLHQKLIESVRHEMEHHFQFRGNLKKFSSHQRLYRRPDDKGNDFFGHISPQKGWYDYVTQPKEIEAYVSGFYLKAKKQRVPLIQLLQQELDEYKRKFMTHGDSDEAAESRVQRIKQLWLDYARKRFPVAQLG